MFLEAAVFLQRIEQFRDVERFGEHPQRAGVDADRPSQGLFSR
jgi:hypothetical protein